MTSGKCGIYEAVSVRVPGRRSSGFSFLRFSPEVKGCHQSQNQNQENKSCDANSKPRDIHWWRVTLWIEILPGFRRVQLVITFCNWRIKIKTSDNLKNEKELTFIEIQQVDDRHTYCHKQKRGRRGAECMSFLIDFRLFDKTYC